MSACDAAAGRRSAIVTVWTDSQGAIGHLRSWRRTRRRSGAPLVIVRWCPRWCVREADALASRRGFVRIGAHVAAPLEHRPPWRDLVC